MFLLFSFSSFPPSLLQAKFLSQDQINGRYEFVLLRLISEIKFIFIFLKYIILGAFPPDSVSVWACSPSIPLPPGFPAWEKEGMSQIPLKFCIFKAASRAPPPCPAAKIPGGGRRRRRKMRMRKEEAQGSKFPFRAPPGKGELGSLRERPEEAEIRVLIRVLLQI